MDLVGTKVGMSILFVLLTVTATTTKNIEISEPEPFHRTQVELSNSSPYEGPSDGELLRYLLAKELVSRHGNLFDWDERQKKRSYWKQCAFNAVSCFGKK